jgi:MFS family permease
MTGIRAKAIHGYVGLARHAEFRALWSGNALGTAASSMSSLALGTLVHAETGSPLLTALVMFGPSLVQVVGAGTLMSLADTFSPRALLSIAAAIAASGFAMQAIFDLPTVGRLLVVFGAAYVLSISGGVRWGLLAEVLPEDGYALGRSAMNVSVGVMQIIGFAIGGLLVSSVPVSSIFWLAVGLAAVSVPIAWFGIGVHQPRRPTRPSLKETWRGNRALLANRSSRSLLIALCVPNGLIAGCEALFVPLVGDAAAMLFVSVAVGMLIGDVLVGRVLRPAHRSVATRWLRILLAAPFVAFLWQPPAWAAVLLVGMAAIGYAASLGQQELLVRLTPRALSGQVLGAESAARVTCQGLAGVLAGAIAEIIPLAIAITVLALGSLLVSALLTSPLRRAEVEAAKRTPDAVMPGFAATIATSA